MRKWWWLRRVAFHDWLWQNHPKVGKYVPMYFADPYYSRKDKNLFDKMEPTRGPEDD